MRYPLRGILAVLWVACVMAFTVACNDDGNGTSQSVDLSQPVHVDPNAGPPEHLSAYNLFTWSQEDGFEYNAETAPYTLNIKLFSDYALKDRGIYVPPGQSLQYEKSDAFDFPVGSLIWKTFYFAKDMREPNKDNTLVETRILLKAEDGWHTYPYLWNDAQTDAVYKPGGQTETIDLIDPAGNARTAHYLVPSQNMCKDCHTLYKDPADKDSRYLVPIGPKARHMNLTRTYPDGTTENQLTYLADRGMLTGLPSLNSVQKDFSFDEVRDIGVDNLTEDQLEKATVDYLDINCAHCHNDHAPGGIASRLYLNYDYTGSALHGGICKKPGSAGNGANGLDYDIVPGDSDDSILYFRIHTEEAGKMMPMIGRSLSHNVGTALVKRWIDNMDPSAGFCGTDG